MTDNEVIKALERIAQYSGFTDDVSNTLFSALDLINQQQAEIDEMKHEREVLIEDIHHSADKINEQLEEIERLKAEEEKYPFKCVMPFNSMVCSKSIEDYDRLVGDIGAEAIKEFAERLKNEIISETAYGCDSNQHTGYYDYQIKIDDIPEYIDNLVKELVGEE